MGPIKRRLKGAGAARKEPRLPKPHPQSRETRARKLGSRSESQKSALIRLSLGGRFDIFHFFCSGEGTGAFEAPGGGGFSFLLKI